MEQKNYILRRIVETVVIEVISSGILFILIMAGFIPSTRIVYIAVFGLSAVLFLELNSHVLYCHLRALEFNPRRYLAINLSIFAAIAGINMVMLKFYSGAVYTAFFGYTKPFRQLFRVSSLQSALIFWGLYLLVIVGVLLKAAYYDLEYRYCAQRRRARKQLRKAKEDEK